MRAPIAFVASLAWAYPASAQQFRLAKQSYDAMHLSEGCTKVLNTNLEHCHSLLFDRTDRSIDNVVEVLPRSELDLICEPKCREELSALRAQIVETCTAPQDIMHNSGLEFPASFFADKFAYTFDINCFKDKSSDRFCDEIRSEWRNGTTKLDQCSRCYLGPLAAMISSPIGVSEARVDRFKQIKAGCGNTEYEPEIAVPYGKPGASMRLAQAEAVEDTRECARWYTMKEGDDCTSIALSQRSSTLSLVQNNGLNINCNSIPGGGTSMPDPGAKLCLDEPCDIHTISPGEGCSAISQKYSITEAQFRAMNPMIDGKCANIARWEGYVACVGPKSLLSGNAQSGHFPTFSSMQSMAAIPFNPRKPPAPGSSTKCIRYANGRSLTDSDLVAIWGVNGGNLASDSIPSQNRCGFVAGLNKIGVQYFRRMNPGLVTTDEGKCSLEEQYSYCVAEEGGPNPELDADWDMQRALRWG